MELRELAERPRIIEALAEIRARRYPDVTSSQVRDVLDADRRRPTVSAETVVVDASVVVSLLIRSTQSGEAIAARLEGAQLHAPDHLPLEVTNVLRRLRIAGTLTDAEATIATDGFWSLAFQLWPFEVVAVRAWQLGYTVSCYDAAYLAIAERLGGTLRTSDARLVRSTGPECAIALFD